jgi:flagellar biogenesis protein FliO
MMMGFGFVGLIITLIFGAIWLLMRYLFQVNQQPPSSSPQNSDLNPK